MKRFQILIMTLVCAAALAATSCKDGGGSNSALLALLTEGDQTTNFMISFSINDVPVTIDQEAGTITVNLPCSVLDVTDLVAVFTHNGASVTANSFDQTSGVSSNDYTDPVTFTVTAENGDIREYEVTVVVAPGSSKAISAFSINGVDGAIDEGTHTIDVVLPCNTDDLSDLVATFTTSGTEVRIVSAVQTSGVTPNDFTSGTLTYTVEACNTTTQDYTVNVTLDTGSDKAMTAYSINGVAGFIHEKSHTIYIPLPCDTTDLSGLVATFSTTGTEVRVGSDVQTSGITPNNFETGLVDYTVEACNGSIQDYTVYVFTLETDEKGIIGFTIGESEGIIVGDHIHVILPAGTALTGLVANFLAIGSSVRVGSTLQTSGTTANDFTGPVTYTVEACDASTTSYIVEVYSFSEEAASYDDNPTMDTFSGRTLSSFKTESDYLASLEISQNKPLIPIYEFNCVLMTTYPPVYMMSFDNGDDDEWFTPDDSCVIIFQQYVNETRKRLVFFNYPDGTISSYALMIYDTSGKMLYYRTYQGSGTDGIWFTGDDVETSSGASRFEVTWNTATSTTGVSHEDDGSTVVNRFTSTRDTVTQVDTYDIKSPDRITTQQVAFDYSHTLKTEYCWMSGSEQVLVKKNLDSSDYVTWQKAYEATADPADGDWWDGDEIFGASIWTEIYMWPYKEFTYDSNGYRETETSYSDQYEIDQEAHVDYTIH